MFYIEIAMYLNTSGYSFHQSLPFSVYGENVFLLGQNLVIIMLFFTYDKSISIVEKLLAPLIIAAYSFILIQDKFIQPELWQLI